MHYLFGIVDVVANMVVGPLMQFANDRAAIRTFGDLVRDKSTQPGQHPGDYILVCFGTLDGQKLDAWAERSVVATGASFAETEPYAGS